MQMKIVTGYENSLDLVTKEVIEQRADYINYKLTYPNGLILEFKIDGEEVNVIPNKPLKEVSPGVYKPVI